MKTMISRLKAARAWAEKRRGKEYSNAEFARGLEVEQASVNYWIDKQEGDLKVTTVFKAADFLGVDARWLATGEGRMSELGDDETTDPDYKIYSNGMLIACVECKWHTPEPSAKQLQAWEAVLRASANGAPDKVFEIISDIGALYESQKGGNLPLPTQNSEPSGSHEQARRVAEAAKKKVAMRGAKNAEGAGRRKRSSG